MTDWNEIYFILLLFLWYHILIVCTEDEMKKQSIFIMVLFALVLTLTVGFALFSDTLTVQGTATARGTFDMQFKEASITEQVGSSNATAIISEDKKSLNINVPRLEYPGAYVLISVEVLNNGSIPSKLTDILPTGLDDDPTVKISYEKLDELKNVTMKNGDSNKFNIKILWDKFSNQSSNDVTFSIKLNYQQAV